MIASTLLPSRRVWGGVAWGGVAWGGVVCALGLMLLLAGCGVGGSTNVDQSLYAQDSILQTLQRLFFPSAYWQKKRDALQADVQHSQSAFRERAQAYHALLNKRREEVVRAMTQAEQTGADPAAARRTAIQALRNTMDPLREETRQLSKKLRHAMALLFQADMAAKQQGL